MGNGLWWAGLYELTLVETAALLIYVLDKVEWLKSIAASPDPQQALLDDSDDITLEWEGGPEGAFSVCGLIEDARERGNDAALFKAIRIERGVVSCPTAAMRISRAEVLGDKRFFTLLRTAMNGPRRRDMT